MARALLLALAVLAAVTVALAPLTTAKLPGPGDPGHEVVCIRLRNTQAPPDTCVMSDGSVCQEDGSGGPTCLDPTP